MQVKSERQDAEIAAITRAQDRATLLEQHVVKTLQVAALASLHLGHIYLTAEAGRGGTRSAALHIEDPSVDIAGVSAVTVVDRDGRTVAASRSGVEPPIRPPFAGTLLYRAGDPDLTISDPQTAGALGQKYIFVTRRIVSDGRVAGYVVLSFAPEQFLNFPLRTKFDRTDLVSVINLNGVTLARREGDRFSSGENVHSGLVMRKQREDPNGTYLGPSSLDGLVRYFSHRRLQDFPVFVTAGVSHSVALLSAKRRAETYYIVMGVLSILGVLMASIIQREAAYRQKKAAELAESTQRLKEAQRVGKIGDWEYDLATGIVIWSEQLCQMYERSPKDDHLTFEDFAAYLLPEDFAKFDADFKCLLANGGSHFYELQVMLPSGKVSHRSINAVASVGHDRKVINLHGTDQDVTHMHLFRELEKQVAHLDRQGAMSMMAGTLAHELSQPLTAASNYITGALRTAVPTKESLDSPVVSALRDALDQIHDAAEIIRRVRKMVRAEADLTKTASIRAAIADAVALLLASGFSAAKAIEIDVEADIPEVLIAHIQLQQVLVNILKNALEVVSEDSGFVSVVVRHGENALVRIEIRDNGPGFPGSPVDAFSAFYSQKKSGTGLGLSISRTIIEYHSGKLVIEKSKRGETLVVISLPSVRSPDSQNDLRALS